MLKKIQSNILKKDTIHYIFACLCLLIPILLTMQIKPILIDDIMYSNWSKDGVQHFFEQQIWHWQNFNGRFIVHFCFTSLLALGSWTYMIIPICMVFGFYFIFNLFMPNKKSINFLMSSICVCLLFLLSKPLISETVFWMAGGFNYLFPFIFLSMAIYKIHKNTEKFSVLTAVLCLVTGATMEQYSIMLGVYLFMLFCFNIKDKQKRNSYLVYGICVVVGFLSIILASPTINRILNRSVTNTNLSQSPLYSIVQFLMLQFTTEGNLIFTIISFAILLFAIIKNPNKYPKISKFLSISLILIVLCTILKINIITIYFMPIMILVIATAMMKKQESRNLGILLFSGFISYITISLFSTCCYRITILFNLILFSMIGICIMDILQNLTNTKHQKILKNVIICTISVLCIYSSINLYVNRTNGQEFLDDLYNQLQNIDETNEVTVNMDKTDFVFEINDVYRHTTIFDGTGASIIKDYQEHFNMPEGIKIKFKSEKINVASICINGKYSYMPAIYENEWMIPLYSLASEYDVSFYTYQVFFIKDGYKYALDVKNSELLIIDNETNILIEKTPTNVKQWIKNKNDTYYVNIDAFCRWLDVEYNIDNELITFYCKN